MLTSCKNIPKLDDSFGNIVELTEVSNSNHLFLQKLKCSFNLSSLKNERGNAMIEIIPVIMLFILIVNFSLGFFGVIHSGIMNSIAARNYAFETFRNRSHLGYLRDNPESDVSFTYSASQLRFHSIVNETRSGNTEKFQATKRAIAFTEINSVQNAKGSQVEHEIGKKIKEGQKASDVGITEGVNPVWIRTTYGICLTTACGNN